MMHVGVVFDDGGDDCHGADDVDDDDDGRVAERLQLRLCTSVAAVSAVGFAVIKRILID